MFPHPGKTDSENSTSGEPWSLPAPSTPPASLLPLTKPGPGGETAAGHDDGPTGIGHSAVVSPFGRRIIEAGYDEQVLVCDIDLADVRRARKAIPVLDWPARTPHSPNPEIN